jgi:16S rRNA G527 N7-methylase RsmG
MPDADRLTRVLRDIQRRGGIGPTTLDAAIAHSEEFLAALPVAAATLVDLGSGGGLPGLVIAVRRPQLRVDLVERRGARADLLRYAVRTLELAGRVRVRETDVRTLVDAGETFEVVTARSFATMPTTLRLAAVLTSAGGRILISQPPGGVSLADELLAELGLHDLGAEGSVRRFARIDVPRGTVPRSSHEGC